MIDAKIVEPLEDAMDGNLCPTAYDDASLLLLNGQMFHLEIHGELPIGPR